MERMPLRVEKSKPHYEILYQRLPGDLFPNDVSNIATRNEAVVSLCIFSVTKKARNSERYSVHFAAV